MIPDEILAEYGNQARAQLDKQIRWKPGDHPEQGGALGLGDGKLLEIVRVQDEELDELRARVEALDART